MSDDTITQALNIGSLEILNKIGTDKESEIEEDIKKNKEQKTIENLYKIVEDMQRQIDGMNCTCTWKPEKLTKTQVRKLKEAELVKYAKSLGIESSEKDKKEDTLKKVLKLIK